MNKILEEYYGLTDSNILPLSGGWMNGKYLITSKENKYVLKIYNHKKIEKMSNGEFSTNYLDKQMVNNLKIVNYMNESGLNCPKVIKTNFNTLTVNYGADRLSLITYIDAKNVDRNNITNIQLYNLGEECYKMHQLFKNVKDDLYIGKYLKIPSLNDLEKNLIDNMSIVSSKNSHEFIKY